MNMLWRYIIDGGSEKTETLVRNSTFLLKLNMAPEDDQSILIETSSFSQRFFSEPPTITSLIRDNYMVLPQTLLQLYVHHAKIQILFKTIFIKYYV